MDKKENIYKEKGYKSREDYLQSLAYDYSLPLFIVKSLADTLGRSEDFDGLINAIEDYILDNELYLEDDYEDDLLDMFDDDFDE